MENAPCMAMETYNREYPISGMKRSTGRNINAELMWAAFLMDIATYFIGPVRGVYENPETEFGILPYHGEQGLFSLNSEALCRTPTLVCIQRKE